MTSTPQPREVEELEAEIFPFLRSVIDAVEIYSSKVKDESGDNGEEEKPSVRKKEKMP